MTQQFLTGQRLTADLLNALAADVAQDPFNEITATSDSALTSTEIVTLTFPSAIYKAGKAYRAWVGGGLITSTAAAEVSFALRKGTAVAGAAICVFTRKSAASATLEEHVNLQMVFTIGASDVTTQLCLTAACVSPNTATFKGATGGNPRHCTIFPAGDAVNWTNRSVLT